MGFWTTVLIAGATCIGVHKIKKNKEEKESIEEERIRRTNTKCRFF